MSLSTLLTGLTLFWIVITCLYWRMAKWWSRGRHVSWQQLKVACFQAWFRQLQLLQQAVMVAQTYQSSSERERNGDLQRL